MAYTYLGDAILGVSLTVETPKPLDTRTVVNATKDLYEVPASQAYRGMTISNLEDGNIYMLIDKNKINAADGWKSSQSALQIVTCTQEEYDAWSTNTDMDYNPIDKDKPYLSQSVYYYIYEDEEGQYYLSSDWGKNIEDLLSKKASADGLNNVLKKTNELAVDLANNYTRTDVIIETYATKELVNSLLNLEDSESTLSKALAPYYTSELVDDKFVTKASLGGDLSDLGDGTNLVFVTSAQYAEDQKAIQEELAKTLKLDGEGSLESITVNQIKSPESDGKLLIVLVTSEGLSINNDLIATESDIPVLITLSRVEYDEAIARGDYDPEAYYCIYDEEDNKLVYVTLKELESAYSTTTLTQFWVAQNFYTRKQIDEIITTIQAGTGEQLEGYYTSTQIDANFLSILEAANTYATKQSLFDLETKINEEYVTKEMLKGSDTEDEDFMFVTSTQYAKDLEELQETLDKTVRIDEDGSVNISQIKNEETIVDIKTDGLYVNNEIIANKSDVPVLITLTAEDYNKRVKEGKILDDAYYYIYDEANNKLVYITLQELEASYSTTNQTQLWVALNFYTMSQMDDKLLALQLGGNEATAELMKNYYTKLESDEKYLTINTANSDLATKSEVEALETKISEEYVTITMLKGTDTEDTDFMFVTLSQYSEDKKAQELKIESNELKSSKATTSELIILEIVEKEVELEGDIENETITTTEQEVIGEIVIAAKDNKLVANDKQIALKEEVPQLECITAEAYEALENPDPETYYCVYDTNEENAWVTQSYVNEYLYTKSQTNLYVADADRALKTELEAKIKTLEEEIQLLKNILFSLVQGKVLTLGMADTIDNNTLIANTAKVENQTLIFT